MLFVCYPKCSTCAAAQKWLDAQGIPYTARDIKEQRPSYDELKEWATLSGLPLKRFFNTSGLVYRALSLKEKLPSLTEEEQLTLLAGDGMLVKRPILIGNGMILVGFKPDDWLKALLST